MKKKLSSLLTIVFVLFAGLFATACGNKYKNFEFKVYYAFSADATEWFDGTNGISLNYDERETITDGEEPSSLIFKNGASTLYIKVEVEGVKAKHIDTVSISATALGGLDFSGATVKEGEVVGISITGTVDTTLKIYENNSGKRFDTKLVVMKQLAKLELVASNTTPAMLIGQNSSLNLHALNNIKYLSLDYIDEQGVEHFTEGETNQTGVTYTIEGIGKYQNGSYIPGTKNINGIFEAKGGSLNYLVKDEENVNGERFLIDSDNHALKIKATSIFHPGTEEAGFTDAISCEFYVCLASTMPQPAVLFRDGKNADGTNIKVETVHLYQNGIKDDAKDYSASYINIGPKYDPVYTVDISLFVNVAQKGQPYNFVKYDFDSGNNVIVSQAGLTITEQGATEGGDYVMYKIAMANVDLLRENKVKVVYEIEGLDFSCGSKQPGETLFNIQKHVVPKEILINNEVVDSDTQIDVYYTTAKYDGVRLDVVATPNEDVNRELTLEYSKNVTIRDAYKNIIPTTNNGNTSISKIKSGSTIYVKFTSDYNALVDIDNITISTSTKGEYDGGSGTVGSVSAICKLNKVVTANSLTFITETGEEIASNGEFLVNAKEVGMIYLKVSYSNGSLEKKSIKLTSSNPKVKFSNGLNEILLSDAKVESGAPVNNGDGLFYSIFKIPINACNSVQSSPITVEAGGVAGSIISNSIKLKSVIVADENWDDVTIAPVNAEDVLTFTNGYAIRKGESATFEFVKAGWVFDVAISSSDKNDTPDDVFDYGAVSLTKAADSKFIVKGNIANRTAIIKVTPTYYNSELIIPEQRKSFEIQIAVYDPIVKVEYEFIGSNSISYVNAFDKDIRSTSFKIIGKTASNATPTQELMFMGETGNEVISNFSQIKIGLEKTENVVFYLNESRIEDGVISGTSGVIGVELIAEENSATSIAAILTPYVNGKVYAQGEVTSVGINIKEVIKTKKLSLSGGGLDDENKSINMSFMAVSDGGYDQKTIYATLEMEDGSIKNSIDKDITYLVYRYIQLSDGTFEEDSKGNRVLEKVFTNAVAVEFEGNKIVIKAYKEFGGGRYMLLFAPKDAYNGADIENITRHDFDSSKTVSIDLNVRDGSAIAPYQIAEYSDLMSINRNISQINIHYELTNNLDLRKYDLTPIGLVGDTINAFQGVFNGAAGTNNQIESETIHTIYLNINRLVTSSNYGSIAGLFAMLGENAIVKNLNLVVDFALSNSYKYVGALAGVNKGQINNVKVSINNTNNINLGRTEGTCFGGIVGLNENKIVASRVEMVKSTKIISSSNSNIGVIAGLNKGEIVGAYLGNESLDNFVFDVLSNLEVLNNTSNTILYVGGVAGVNSGIIRNMLIGGKLGVGHIDEATNPKDSFLGGVVGVNQSLDEGDNALIDTVTALALDIESTATGVDVAGIAGKSAGNINFAKYITAQVKFGFGQANGQVKGLKNVAGIVAQADGATITYSSVESFVLTQIDQTRAGEKTNYPTLVSNTEDLNCVVAGLVASGSANISNSFVKGNIKGKNIYLLSNNSSENSYFIGYADGTINDNGKNATYYLLYDFASNRTIEVNYTIQENDAWENEENVNNVGGVDYSYLIKDGKALMILAPQSISANLNQNYQVKPGSVYINEFNIELYENQIEETILVNYFNNAGNEGNTHNIVNTATQPGLVQITKIPVNAQTGLRFEIVGDGYRFAYINSANQIVFTGVSGTTPILVRIYSIFNPDVESYVVFYTHILASEISLGTEEISLYTGMGGKVLSLQAENIYNGVENLTLFNTNDLDQYLIVEASIKNSNGDDVTENGSKLNISISSYNNIFIIINDGATIGETQYEDITLTLYLSKDYYSAAQMANNIALATVSLRVNLYNVASGVNITGNKEEMPTNGDLSFKAYLNTDYYVADSASKVFTSNGIKANEGDVEIVDKNKSLIVRDADEDCDSIKVKFAVTHGEAEVEKLLRQSGEEHFIDLFNITFIRKLHKIEDVVVGYVYDIQAELKDQFEYRYIENNITFGIIVMAESNESAADSMVVTLKPTMATTLSFKTYAVQSLQMETDYTSLVTSENEEVLIIEPGKLGNIFLINIQPSYAFIDVASITSSELYVPSLNRNVRMMFTQLVYRDNAKGGKGSWTTTLGTNVQQGNTLELQRISKLDSKGKAIYDGKICLYVQVEGFSGLAGNLTATINVTTKSGEETQTLVRNKMLTTTYMPSVNVVFDSNKYINGNHYYIQEGTSNNAVDIKIQGYQFNADPIVTISWVEYKDGQYIDKTMDGKLVGDYITWYFVNDKDSAKYSEIDDSYTIGIKMSISKDMPSAFAIEVGQSLVGKDGAITTAKKRVIFHPVDYYLNSIYVSNVNMQINQEDTLNLVFNTDNTSYNPVAEMIELFNQAYGDEFITEFKKLFTYYKDGETISFADIQDKFTVEFIEEGNILSIHGLKTFSAVVNFTVPYYYQEDENGTYKIKFDTAQNPYVKSTTFNLDITPVNTEVEILVRDASDIFANGQWKLQAGANYVLLNDITLENITPITTPIKSFDGNNRIITVKSFLVNDSLSNYGLFATLEQDTTLKNMMVDYSKFDTLALNNNTTSKVVFGGLVAENNGGIIYNCDVINNSEIKHKEISIIVSNTTDVVFGGLVGINNGVITNSRVGTSKYTRIEQNRVPVSVGLGGLTFEIYNQIIDDETNNRFNILAGGFVGENAGTITTSYVSNTDLVNHSNANTTDGTNQTAGFVARNTGDIQYAYVRADENTITYANPYATGYKIENRGNGIVAGFVFENRGTISNSYSNTELKTDSAYIAGFAYTNFGSLHENYAACTMNAGSVDNNAEQPFIGLNERNELQSFGKIENSYYLIRSANDVPIQQDDKDIAYGLDYTNIQNSEYLVGFAFVLTNTKQEREQGIWSYYSIDGSQRALPELINADKVAYSYRYLKDMGDGTEVLTNVAEFKQGKSTNPYTIATAEEFNNVFKSSGSEFVGSVRLINNIDFIGLSVQTRTNFVLGKSGELTSVDGNGLTIKNIYLEADETILEKMGLFAEINNAYVKNLNLNFVESKAGDQFSTTTAVYSGGLAGKIEDSVALNITLDGRNTTLAGRNFVGGLAGLITGDSLIYGVSTNVSVRAISTGDGLYYKNSDFDALSIAGGTSLTYDNYLKTLSYAGGIAGVIDINARSNTKFNVQYIDVFGSQMTRKESQGNADANILAEYSGGVAGYAGRTTDAYRLRYFTGKDERIVGDTAVGGIYGVLFGDMTACQVTADVDTQYEYDTLIGEYIDKLHDNDQTVQLDKDKIGNLNLLQSDKYVGGLVGIAAGASLKATYAKVGISSGATIGGLVGSSISCIVNYSYAIPYVNVDNISTKTIDNEDIKINIGGLMGEAHSISSTKAGVGEYIKYLKRYSGSHQGTDVQFTYSTIVVDNVAHEGDITMDYIVADFLNDKNETMLQSNASSKLVYVFAGTVDYTANITYNPKNGVQIVRALVQNETSAEVGTSKNETSIMELHKLFPDDDEDVVQQVAFQDVFSAWGVIKYWSLKKEKYFPLLMNDIVDNLIEIKNANDLNKITNNPDADFIIVDDITIEVQNANWVIRPTFTGTITGARKSDNRRPVITVKGLKATEDESMGFFKETRNAKITNIEIVWGGGFSDKGGGFNTNNKNITMISGLICKDQNSLISNVMISGNIYNTGASGSGDNDGYVLNTSNAIEGFAGIVGTGNRTNIMGCVFAGKVDAKFTAKENPVYVAGAACEFETGNLDSDINSNDAQNAIITNTQIGVAQELANKEDSSRRYPVTEFDLTFEGKNPIYVGGVVAHARHVGLNNNMVGGASYLGNYQNIVFNLSFSNTTGYANFGGLAGYADRGLVSGCKAVTQLCATGTINTNGTESGNNINFGGLIGVYRQNHDDPGISDSSTRAKFTFANENAALNAISDQTNVRLSNGIAEIGTGTTLNRCLFTGEINAEGNNHYTPSITNIYAGSIAAYNSGDAAIINEVNTYCVNIVGTPSTKRLYAGGSIGWASNININNCANWDRIVPITSAEATAVYVGGMIGMAGMNDNKIKVQVTNAYSAVSIITDSVGPKAISIMNTGALIGGVDNTTEGVKEIKFAKVFYSSDLALTPEENVTQYNLDEVHNYEASTILTNTNWHSEFISLDKDVWKNSNSSIPYLTSLEDVMKEYQILVKQHEGYRFRQGSVFRPIVIQNKGDITQDANGEYNYYLLNTTESDTAISLSDNDYLNGIIIGENKDINITSQLVKNVKKHSAISNVHVNFEPNTVFYNSAVIADSNEGVIFNCSVQGTGINAKALWGIISSYNKGMIAYSYSGMEIIEAGITSGICSNNQNGRLLSNYFTGYINSSSGYGITQYAGTDERKSYIYNNYMAGVINKTGNNKVVGGAFAGSNNYVDSYSDIGYANNINIANNNLIAVKTSDLMRSGLLAGRWYYVAENKVAEGQTASISLNTDATTFGYNYNYPVYNFNKEEHEVINENAKPVDTKHLLYTGNGLFSEDVGIAGAEYEARYNNILTPSENYQNAFKISHLGVLSSVLSVVEDDKGYGKNFVFIYDIDGVYSSGEDKSVEWKYENQSINGFTTTTFTGIVISHKYYGYDENASQVSPVTIKNISNHGLFNEVGKAYFGNITLGTFSELKNSGALAVKTTNEDENIDIVVNNITFEDETIISGANVSKNVFGSLFGTVYERLIVKNYKSVSASKVLLGLDAQNNASAGLIAGACIEGAILLDAETESTFYANIIGGEYAGGVVGKLSGGQICGEGNTINICDNSEFNEENGDKTPKFIGGIAGLITESPNATFESDIHNVTVNIIGKGNQVTINTNAFGGVIGVVQSGTVNIGSSDEASELQILSDGNYTPGGVLVTAGEIGAGSDKTIIFKSSGSNNYYGLTIGLINGGTAKIINFNIGNPNDNSDNLTIEIVKEDEQIMPLEAGTTQVSDTSKNCGAAIFVGAMKTVQNESLKSELNFEALEVKLNISLKSEFIPNVGGVIGLYEGGTLDLDITFADEIFITIEGSTNIGGVIGYATAKIDFVENALGLFASETEFAKISALPGKNIGGLIGKWTLDETYQTGFINPNSITMDYLNLDKEDEESINNGEHVENVGGVVGYLSTTLEISGLSNKGNIDYGNFLTEDYIGNITNKTEDESGNFKFLSAVNVGGVVGLLDGGTLSNLANNGNIAGYQNVGGLVGTVTGATLTNCGINIGEKAYISYNKENKQFEINQEPVDPPPTGGSVTTTAAEFDGSDENVVTIEAASTGNIAGVFNVGGAVGLAEGKNTTISKVVTMANVKGNANVGGLVGETYKANIVKNFVGIIPSELSGEDAEASPAAEASDDNKAQIKAIYYNQYKIDGGKLTLMAGFIPTAIGGLAGKATEGSYINNIEHKIAIISAEEGSKSGAEALNPAISIDKNVMFDVVDQTPQTTYDTSFAEPDPQENIVEFKDIKSGYGGLFGLSENTDLGNSNEKASTLVNMSLSAQLGVNVGTYYGGYLATGSPNFGALQVHGDVVIEGAYNIGGIVGCVDVSAGTNGIDKISDKDLSGSGEVHLQPNMSGINVGGLIGKTVTNNISNLSLTGDSRIVIHTANSYNIGGLIGCAEVCFNGGNSASIEGEFTPRSILSVVKGDAVNNFGGLIGLLKVGRGGGSVTVSVSGTHYNAFTINTIENENYYDGDSRFNINDSNLEVKLYAEAYYVNQDTFTIAPTSEKSWYGENANNPTNPKNTKGWAKDYTGFKVLQRRIPKEANSNKWDSIGVLYDAGCIKQVGTLSNLGLYDEKNIIQGYNGPLLEDYICFTIYEKDDLAPMLYSAVGVATPMVNSNENVSQKYINLEDDPESKWSQLFNIVMNTEPEVKGQYYISANQAKTTKNGSYAALKALNYFDWQEEYKTISGKDRKFQNDIDGAIYNVTDLAYFVKGYDGGDATYDGSTGAWFVFNLVYENETANGMTANGVDGAISNISNDYLPKSGSVFEASGMYKNHTHDVKINANDIDDTAEVVFWSMLAVDIIITFLTGGGWGAVKAGAGAVAKAGIKVVVKKSLWSTLKNCAKIAGKFTLETCKAWGFEFAKIAAKKGTRYFATMIMASLPVVYMLTQPTFQSKADASYESISNFVQPQDLNYGYLSSSYSKKISYVKEGDKIYEKHKSDDVLIDKDNGEMYLYYSNDRPADFHGAWIGTSVNNVSDNSYTLAEQEMHDIDISEYPNIHKGNKLLVGNDVISDNLTLYSNDSSQLIYAVKKYIYKSGSYYINQNACSVEYEPVSLIDLFKKGFYEDNQGNQQPYLEPHFFMDGGNIYDSCQFSNGKYSFGYDTSKGYTGVDTGNLIKDENGSYTLHNKPIAKDVVEKTKKLNYRWANTEPADARLGYTWFDYAYYAYAGDKTSGAPVKYAKFSEPQPTKPSGTLGVDYITDGTWTNFQAEGTYNGDINAVIGKWYKSGSEYKEINSGTTLSLGTTVYTRSTGDYYRTFTGEVSDTAKGKDYLQIYPYSFTNPYYKTNNGSNAKVTFTSGGYVNGENGAIAHSPTYYLWQGGYIVVEVNGRNMIYIQAPHQIDYTDINTGMITSTSPIIKLKTYTRNANGEIVPQGTVIDDITLTNIVAGWDNTYNSGYIVVDGEQGEIVVDVLDELYQVKNGNLYKYNSEFVMDSNSKLCTQYLQVPEVYAVPKLYLSNSSCALYTRYKYTADGKYSFDDTPNGWTSDDGTDYRITPFSGSSIYLNDGKTTIFTETCRVIFGTGGNVFNVNGSSTATCSSGRIIIT